MIKTMEIMQGEKDAPFKFTIVPTMFDKRTKASLLAFKRLQELYSTQVWPGVVPIDTNLRNASVSQKVPSDYAANSRGTIAYKSLLNYLIKQHVDDQKGKS
jgi:chromosome partitioning protein